MRVMFRDFGLFRYLPTDQRIGQPLSPHNQVGQPLPDAKYFERRYQRTPENSPTEWFVALNADSVVDEKYFKSVVVPAGEKLELTKHLPGWNRLTDAGYVVGCGGTGEADIYISNVSDPDTPVLTLATALDLSTPTDAAIDINGGAGQYIQREDSMLLTVAITPPFTDADGNGVFVLNENTPCEECSCVHLMVRAHLRNMCFHERLRGCRIEDYACGCGLMDAEDPCATTP